MAKRRVRATPAEVAIRANHLTGPSAPARLSSAIGTAFAPTAHQRLALSAIIEEPALAGNKAALARSTGLSTRSLSRWFADEGFRRWWDAQLLDLARARMGEAALSLQRVIDSSTSDVARVRAVEALVKLLGQPKAGVAEAVTAILEKWGRGRARMAVDEGGRMALEVEGESSPLDSTKKERTSADFCPSSDKSPYVELLSANPPPGAMATSPDKADELAARARLQERVRGRVFASDIGGGEVVDRRDATLPRAVPTPSRRRPRLARREGAGENNKNDRGERQGSAGSSSPKSALPPGKRADFRGLPYAPRVGPKAPPGGAPDREVDPEDPFS